MFHEIFFSLIVGSLFKSAINFLAAFPLKVGVASIFLAILLPPINMSFTVIFLMFYIPSIKPIINEFKILI